MLLQVGDLYMIKKSPSLKLGPARDIMVNVVVFFFFFFFDPKRRRLY